MFTLLITALAAPSPVVTLPTVITTPPWPALTVFEAHEMSVHLKETVPYDTLAEHLELSGDTQVARWGINVDRFDGTGMYYVVLRVDRPGQRDLRVRCKARGQVDGWSFSPTTRVTDPTAVYGSMATSCRQAVAEKRAR